MKNIYAIYKKCRDMLVGIDIECGKVSNLIVNSRAKNRWGNCRFKKETHSYEIQLSDRLLQDGVADDGAVQTMLHELLHTVDGCLNHGAKWKSLAEKVYKNYGIVIKRTNSADEKGVPDNKPMEAKYVFKCERCGCVVTRYRASRFTELYQYYRCGCCHIGKFRKVI